jgi:hypothetical protein
MRAQVPRGPYEWSLTSVSSCPDRGKSTVAYRCAWKNEQAQKHSDSANERSCKCCNASKQETVYGSLDEGIAGIDAKPEGFRDARHGGPSEG